MKTMSGQARFDAATSREVEALYLTPEVAAQRFQVLKALELREGERVIDIGCGPGLLAHEMAASVGRDGCVCGIDISEDMLALSRERCAEQNSAKFQMAEATDLPHPEDSFDAAVSTQVYEYVADVPAALSELWRVTRPGGRVVIIDTDYGSLVIHTENQARTERVVQAWDDHFLHPGLPRILSRLLRDAGFIIRRRDVIPMFNPEYQDNSYGRRLFGMMASFAVGRKHISRHEADAWLAEFAELGRQGRFFFSLNRYLFVADKPDAG
jgi:ubiquinone/menaquinone biosynthesis C-methylase UbiE